MLTDEQLARRAKKGSRKAADELFDRCYRKVYAYVYRQCADRELAMDLTQDTFLAAFRGIRSFDGNKSSFLTWITRIAANKVTDYYRSKRHRERLAELPLDELPGDAADEQDVLSALIRREQIRRIMEAAADFPVPWMHIFQAKCIEEKTFPEIAREANLPESTVKTRYYQMIRRIKEALSHDDEH